MNRIIPPADFDEYDWRLQESKGYLDDVGVELSDGRVVQVTFYDPVRLAQDIEAEFGEGSTTVSFKRLIVVERVTPETLQSAVEAASPNFFD